MSFVAPPPGIFVAPGASSLALASVKADRRAVLRPTSRSPAAWCSSRAASAARWQLSANARARLRLGFGCRGQLRPRPRVTTIRALGLDLLARHLRARPRSRRADCLLGQTRWARGAGRRIGGDREAIPTPEIAVGRDQPLARLELFGDKVRSFLAHDHADLQQPAGELGRRPHMLGQRLDAGRQLGIGSLDGGAGPAHGRRGIDRRFEIVAERGSGAASKPLSTPRLSMTPGQRFLVSTMQQPGEGFGFGVDTLHAPNSASSSGGRATSSAWRAAECAASGADRGGFGFGHSPLCACLDTTKCGQRGDGSGPPCGLRRSELGLDGGGLGFERLARSACSAHRAGEAGCAGPQVGEGAGQLCEGLFRAAASTSSSATTRASAPARSSAFRLRLTLAALPSSAASRPSAACASLASPPARARYPHQADEALVELGDALLGAQSPRARAFRGQPPIAAGQLPRRPRRRARPEARRPPRPDVWTPRPARRCAPPPRGPRDHLACSGFRCLAIGRHPAQVKQGRFGLADLLGDHAIADRACLAWRLSASIWAASWLMTSSSRVKLCSAARSRSSSLVPPRVQAGDAGGFLEHASALLGLGVDDLADASLVDESGEREPGRCIGQQDLHVAGAHLAAVDPIGRARLALDAARHVEGFVIVELRRRGAVGIVDRDGDFGMCCAPAECWCRQRSRHPCRPRASPCRRSAHDPAQRFDQI